MKRCICKIMHVNLGFPLTMLVGLWGLPLWLALYRLCDCGKRQP